mgnify:CR=1 FL=1
MKNIAKIADILLKILAIQRWILYNNCKDNSKKRGIKMTVRLNENYIKPFVDAKELEAIPYSGNIFSKLEVSNRKELFAKLNRAAEPCE